jgi:hypothetical protein
MHSFNEQSPTASTGSITDFNTNTLSPDQSEEGSEENSAPEPIDKVDEPNIVEEETQDTQIDRYPSRNHRQNPRYFTEPTEEEERAMFATETITFNTQDE